MIDSQLLCCDLMEEMHNSNTEIIDTDIGLFCVVRFDIMYVAVVHCYGAGWSGNCCVVLNV
jgi:glutathionyl-hydroquinone reductase